MAECEFIALSGNRCDRWVAFGCKYCTVHGSVMDQVEKLYKDIVNFFKRKHGVS